MKKKKSLPVIAFVESLQTRMDHSKTVTMLSIL
ncbi:unnamed protein product [Ranitomeya imitator]|uniref:Uncharacterized protein n=1 Tax=Ranitomeya imitator TaxID=111125 RepID=A0ABN9KZT6_9NEOB|nr:unnamed protein product [Ranitomeya imitator]